MTDLPVVVIAFNRPDLSARGLELLRSVRPARLFVVLDGPRADRPGDEERTAAVRQLFDDLDWPVDVRYRTSPTNIGCEANVELGLDWVFTQVDRAVVLEDDCLPHPSFFRYAEELLDRYADDRRVWHVAGNSHHVPPALFGRHSYAFSTWASVWGWATWADRWQRHRALFPRDHGLRPDGTRAEEPVRTVPALPRPGTLVTPGGRRHFAEAAASADVVTHGWDKHWWLTIMSEGGLSVTPRVNLVENVGFGPGATHSTAERSGSPACPAPDPMLHPDAVALDVEVERELELALGRIGGRAARLARSFIRSSRVRAAARRVVHGRVATDAARALSRLRGRFGRRG